MARKKNSTKSIEPAQPEVQPEVVSEEKVESGETQPEIQLEMVPVPELDAPLDIPQAESQGSIIEETPPAPGTESEEEDPEAPAAPETNVVTNLPLEEGEELYTVTKADLERIPELVEEGVKEGEQIILGPVVSPEEIILDALNEEEFVEIGDVLEQFVNNPEDQQENRFLKKLLTGMIAEGQIEVQNQVHLLLGSAYYKSGDPVTRYQTLRTVPVYAKKKG